MHARTLHLCTVSLLLVTMCMNTDARVGDTAAENDVNTSGDDVTGDSDVVAVDSPIALPREARRRWDDVTTAAPRPGEDANSDDGGRSPGSADDSATSRSFPTRRPSLFTSRESSQVVSPRATPVAMTTTTTTAASRWGSRRRKPGLFGGSWGAGPTTTVAPADVRDPSENIYIGTIFPQSQWKTVRRRFNSSVGNVLTSMKLEDYNFTREYRVIQVTEYLEVFQTKPSHVLDALCKLLDKQVSTIMFYMPSHELEFSFGQMTAASQFLINLGGYHGIPMITWNADNCGFDLDPEALILQMAPTTDHMCKAMLDFMKRYNWNQFSVVTSSISGYDNFIQAVRRQASHMKEFKFTLLETVILDIPAVDGIEPDVVNDLKKSLAYIRQTDTRIFLLYATTGHAKNILEAARQLGLTSHKYMWIVTQVTIGSTVEDPVHIETFPIGMVGMHFLTSDKEGIYIATQAEPATHAWLKAFDQFYNKVRREQGNVDLRTHFSCTNATQRWKYGSMLYKSIMQQDIALMNSKTGVLDRRFGFNQRTAQSKYITLVVLNLDEDHKWHQVGTWTQESLQITDITWPGNSRFPPKGVPERFNLTVVTLEEPPFVISKELDVETGDCNRGIKCRVSPEAELGSNQTVEYKCFSGLCIDLLDNLARDMNFDFKLHRVADGRWGGLAKNGTWNGLIADLINNKADACMTSLKITPKRSMAVDFTEPFMDTGIAIAVALREGSISTTAFLQPFDLKSWMMILLVFINGTALFLFIFEWMSPYGFNMHLHPPAGHRFSLFRAVWVVYTILFGASTPFDQPRGFVSRALANVWALFSLVFLASYTANLIKFMIADDEYFNLKGIEDNRLINPTHYDPAFKFGTIPFGSTEENIKANQPYMYRYMQQYNTDTLAAGVKQVKEGKLHAFVYDAMALQYLVGQDNDCRLLQVGSWFAMTGYGIAFPKNSKFIKKINRQVLAYRESGMLERLQRFWFMGDCKRQDQEKEVSSNPLQIKHVSSTFIMLLIGMGLALVLLILEHCYFNYVRQHLRKIDRCGICGLISISMGKSLSMANAVMEAHEAIKHFRCRNPVCEQQVNHVRHELQLARLKVQYLEEQNLKRKRLGFPSSESVDRLRVRTPESGPPPLPPTTATLSNNSLPPNYVDAMTPPVSSRRSPALPLSLHAAYPDYTAAGDMPLRPPHSPILHFRRDVAPRGGGEEDGGGMREAGGAGEPVSPLPQSKYRDGHRYNKVPDLDVYEIETVL